MTDMTQYTDKEIRHFYAVHQARALDENYTMWADNFDDSTFLHRCFQITQEYMRRFEFDPHFHARLETLEKARDIMYAEDDADKAEFEQEMKILYFD